MCSLNARTDETSTPPLRSIAAACCSAVSPAMSLTISDAGRGGVVWADTTPGKSKAAITAATIEIRLNMSTLLMGDDATVPRRDVTSEAGTFTIQRRLYFSISNDVETWHGSAYV